MFQKINDKEFKMSFSDRRLRMIAQTLPLPLSWTWSGPPRWESTPSSSATTGTSENPSTLRGAERRGVCMRCVFSWQVHERCGVSGPDHASGDPGWKRLHWLPDLWHSGIPSCHPHPLHNRPYRPTATVRDGQHRLWSRLPHNGFHSWEWVMRCGLRWYV